jgi:hypothetical protein
MIGSPPYRVKRSSLARLFVPERLAQSDHHPSDHLLFFLLLLRIPIFVSASSVPGGQLNGRRAVRIDEIAMQKGYNITSGRQGTGNLGKGGESVPEFRVLPSKFSHLEITGSLAKANYVI